MRAKLWLALALTPALLATTCFYYVGVEVEPGDTPADPPAFRFEYRGDPVAVEAFQVSVCPDTAEYVSPDAFPYPASAIAWRIVREERRPARPEDLRIVYGQVPAGFREETRAQPLRPGGCYHAGAQGRTPKETSTVHGGEMLHVLPDGRLLTSESGGLAGPRPFREINRASVACARGYRRALTAADSAAVDERAFSVMDASLTCGWLNENWPDLMSNPRSGERTTLALILSGAAVLAGILASSYETPD